jgi:hypothetical protein
MANGVNMAIAIGSIFNTIIERLEFSSVFIVVCTNLFSLYEYLVKLGTIKEKRLMINIMALKQAYEQKDVFEIRWINGQDNPADAMTKATSNRALSILIDINRLCLRVQGWVQRGTQGDNGVTKG